MRTESWNIKYLIVHEFTLRIILLKIIYCVNYTHISMYYTLIYNIQKQSKNNQILIALLSVLRASNQFNFQNNGFEEIFLKDFWMLIIDRSICSSLK